MAKTITRKHENFRTKSGHYLFVEQYATAPDYTWLWRMGEQGGDIINEGLNVKPNVRLLKKTFGFEDEEV